MSTPLVEVLTFEGCPHGEPALELVRRVVADSGISATVRRIDVPDAETAKSQRFLGSPTIRVAGVDVDPHAEGRDDYVLSCRVYQTDSGFAGQPDERWVRDALLRQKRDA